MLLSQKRLLQVLGALWLIDGLFQLQPRMFTMDLINSVMTPASQGQPAMIAVSLAWIIHITTLHLVLMNSGIAVVQILLGLSLLIGSVRWSTGRFIKGTLIVSIVWAGIVWYAGEGMNMLLTGQASILTGAPGAVLFYALLALVVYPRATVSPDKNTTVAGEPTGLLSRRHLRWCFAAFWLISALLQCQPFWWQSQQIAQVIGANAGQGGLNALLVDPVVIWLSHLAGNAEISLNIALIVLFVGLSVSLLLLKDEQVVPVLIVSLAVSFFIWWVAQGLGMIFTGMTTDFNSGLLLIVIALACLPRPQPLASPSVDHTDIRMVDSLQIALTPLPVQSSGSQASISLQTVHRTDSIAVQKKPTPVRAAKRQPRQNRKHVQANKTHTHSRAQKRATSLRIASRKSALKQLV